MKIFAILFIVLASTSAIDVNQGKLIYFIDMQH
jgi:hypothetical protein